MKFSPLRCSTFLTLCVSLLLACTAPAEARQRAVRRSATPGLGEVTRVFVVILENQDLPLALQQPFMSRLAADGALLNNYNSLGHPSQPNYIGLTSGDLHGVTDDNTVTLDVRNLADLLEEHHISWKVYGESYPGNCFLGGEAGNATNGLYVRRHNPLINYASVQRNADRCSRIVNSSQLDADVATSSLPQFAMYLPNSHNSGHDAGGTTGVAIADSWLQSRFQDLLQNPRFMTGTLFVVLFDEGWHTNTVYCAFYGAGVQRGATSAVRYGHYDLLRTIEEIFHLGTLQQRDATAQVIDGIWRR